MESSEWWSKDKTLKLIQLLQANCDLWNPSSGTFRREKQRRREELRILSENLEIPVSDITKKIQHLRTQYNREVARENRMRIEEPSERYISNWYAYEHLHFLKDNARPYAVLNSDRVSGLSSQVENSADRKRANISPIPKTSRSDVMTHLKSEVIYPLSPKRTRDEFTVFGEYVANELRSLKGERNLLIVKKKIQDVIFDVKMGLMSDSRKEQASLCTVYSSQGTPIHNAKVYAGPSISGTIVESLPPQPPTTGINEIILNGACHYTNFKVDNLDNH